MGGPGDAAGHPQIHAVGARRRAVVPEQHRVHPPHQRARQRRRGQEIVFAASYLVLGLGDVYLGAPVATPVDPRHRLVTTKYNPARTWTPENAVGIGGAYLCVYGMEGPGGYQFVGRTCQMYNRYRTFEGGKRWLLRFFDQIRFYPVSEQELLAFREAFPRGRAKLLISSRPHSGSPTTRRSCARTATRSHRSRRASKPRSTRSASGGSFYRRPKRLILRSTSRRSRRSAPTRCAVRSQVAGSVWQVVVAPGDQVEAGDKLVVLETMKMETLVTATRDGVVAAIHCKQGALVLAGALLVVLKTE